MLTRENALSECFGPPFRALPSRTPRTPKHVYRRLADERVRQLIAAYQDGARVDDIAAKLGVDQSTVHSHLARLGFHDRGRKLTADRLPRIAELCEQGQSLSAIARQFNVWPASIGYALKKLGVPLRRRRGWNYSSGAACEDQ